MAPFLTVKEAARLTGKSPSSIRRVIYPIIEDDKHPDRVHIQPSVEEALQLRMKGENYAWRLSEELLRREVPVEAATEQGTGASTSKRSASPADGDLLAMLRRELEIKNQQIAQQAGLLAKHMELVNGLSERLHEGNILIGTLQQRLSLRSGQESPVAEVVNAKPSPPAPQKKPSSAAAKAKPKKGFLARLFGSR